MNKNDYENDFEPELWSVSCQLRALGEMLMFQKREPALDEPDIWYGYGSLIRAIGERLAVLAKLQDEEQVKKAKKTNPKGF